LLRAELPARCELNAGNALAVGSRGPCPQPGAVLAGLPRHFHILERFAAVIDHFDAKGIIEQPPGRTVRSTDLGDGGGYRGREHRVFATGDECQGGDHCDEAPGHHGLLSLDMRQTPATLRTSLDSDRIAHRKLAWRAMHQVLAEDRAEARESAECGEGAERFLLG